MNFRRPSKRPRASDFYDLDDDTSKRNEDGYLRANILDEEFHEAESIEGTTSSDSAFSGDPQGSPGVLNDVSMQKNEEDSDGEGFPDNVSIHSEGAVCGEPIMKNVFEKPLLKDPHELWLTPLITSIVRPWVKKTIKTVSHHDMRAYKDPTLIRLPRPATQQVILDSKVMDPSSYEVCQQYQVGDNVIIKPRRRIGSVEGKTGPYRVAKITRITKTAPTSSTGFHVHEYIRAKDTFLGYVARSDELFTTDFSADIQLSDVLGRCNVLEVKHPTNVLQEGHLPPGYPFFASKHFSFSIDEGGSFEFEPAFTDILWENWSTCQRTHQFTTAKISRVYHRGDCIMYKDESELLCGFGFILAVNHSTFLIQRFVRRNGEELAHWISEGETHSGRELVLLTTTNQIPRDSVINRCFIDYKSPEELLRSPERPGGDYYFNSIASRDSWELPRQISKVEAEEFFFSKRCQTCLEVAKIRAEQNINLKETQLKLLDLFAGGGGLSLGLTASKRVFNSVALDISPSASETIRENSSRGTGVLNAEINRYLQHTTKHNGVTCNCPDSVASKRFVQNRQLPVLEKDIDIIALGPPCPENSTLNQFNDAQDKNLSLLTALSYVDLLDPKYIVLENVRGIMNWEVREGDTKGSGMALVIKCLLSMGYQICFGLLNAIHFGVPQRRIRFFLLAAKEGITLPRIPSPTHFNTEFKKPMKISMKTENSVWYCWSAAAEKSVAQMESLTVTDAISDLPAFDWRLRPEWENNEKNLPAWLGFEIKGHATDPKNYFQNACRGSWTEGAPLQHFTPLYSSVAMKNIIRVPRIPGAHLNDIPVEEQELEWQTSAPESAHMRQGMKKEIYARLFENGYFRALTTNFGPVAKQSRILHPKQRRVLTVREQARAQGFPDHWTFCSVNNDPKDMIRQIGNAVPIQVGEAIEREIFAAHFVDVARRQGIIDLD